MSTVHRVFVGHVIGGVKGLLKKAGIGRGVHRQLDWLCTDMGRFSAFLEVGTRAVRWDP